MFSKQWWFLLAVALCVSALTMRLGFWQLGRAEQKEAIHAQQQAQFQAPPLLTSQLLDAPDVASSLYRPVQLQGHWLGANTVFLANRSLQGQPGFLVLTPLVLQERTAVLVVRGWAQRDWVDSNKLPTIETPEGLVSVRGVWVSPPSHMMELAALPTQPSEASGFISLRQNIDLDSYAKETGLRIVATVQQTGEASEGLIRQAPSILLGSDKNRAYALQWFALSLLCLGLFVWFQIIQKIKHG